jgi:alpha-beta hydrolase superfamily lysophospholipase
MVSSKFKDEERVATIALLHGFAENQSTSWFEAAMMYAMNGFEVIMADYKGSGLSSGPRAGGYIMQDSHE